MTEVSFAQDMIYVKRILISLELKAKSPMMIDIDNRVTVDLINTCSVGGITRHFYICQLFLREIKEQEMF